jgi:2,3-bisphosphoglycerate-independent phosphoglycerate mutase
VTKRVLFLFLDGVGLGAGDPMVNPLAAARYPTLDHLLDGHKAVAESGRLSTPLAELIPTDAQMGIPGRPQSATGQAALLTGINAPQRLGEHYGPRPDGRVRAILDEASIFHRLHHRLHDVGLRAGFANAYPQRYFDAVRSGKRLLSAVPYAATVGGLRLFGYDDLAAGRALAADFTNAGWRDELGYADTPVYTPEEGGRVLWRIAQAYDFLFYEHWYTDVLGHAGNLAGAVANFQRFDRFLGGLLEVVDLERTLIIITSDHGNVEDCSHGKHTENPALTLLLGAQRKEFAGEIHGLTDFVPVIKRFLFAEES